MDKRETVVPENELLDLIRNPSKAKGLVQEQIRQRRWFSLFSLAALKGRFSFFAEKIKFAAPKSFFDQEGLNNILKFLIGVMLVYFIGSFIFSMKNLNRIPIFTVGESQIAEEISEETDMANQISSYLEKTQDRDVFQFKDSITQPKEDEAPPPVEQSASSEENPLNYLSLVGISDSDVMIKDTKNQEVHFLKRGESIGEDIKVHDILRDRVILLYQGRKVELK